MTTLPQAIKAGIVDKYQSIAPKSVIQAVASAARKTGVDFRFLMEKARAESSFNPAAKAKTSTASGLYQFIESTWLQTVKKHGGEFGLGDVADKIEIKNGRACVTDCGDRKDILALRNDPTVAALMAGAFTADNKAYLEKNTQGRVGPTEMYFAHFMGANGAAEFLNNRAENAQGIAAKDFPAAAKANKNVFYDPATGKARTYEQVYAFFAKKFTTDTDAPSPPAKSPTSLVARGVSEAPAYRPALPPAGLAQAHPLLKTAEETGDIADALAARPRGRRHDGFMPVTHSVAQNANSTLAGVRSTIQKLSPASILLIAEIQKNVIPESRRYNA
jgi:hypothetical protein